MNNIKISLEDIWENAIKISEERHNQKKNFKSCNPLSPNYELVGILGEYLFSLVIQKPFDTRLLINGDNGFDFDKINIKTSEEKKAKHLIEYVDKKFDGYYIFVIINLEEKYGYIKGYINSNRFNKICEIIDFGYGKRKAITLDKLKEYTPKKPLKLKTL